jgi:hypothetical protein
METLFTGCGSPIITPHLLSCMQGPTRRPAPVTRALEPPYRRETHDEEHREPHALTMEPKPGEPDRRRQSQIGNTSARVQNERQAHRTKRVPKSIHAGLPITLLPQENKNGCQRAVQPGRGRPATRDVAGRRFLHHCSRFTAKFQHLLQRSNAKKQRLFYRTCTDRGEASLSQYKSYNKIHTQSPVPVSG